MERKFNIGDIVVPKRHIREEVITGSIFEEAFTSINGPVVAVHEYSSRIEIDVDTYDEDGEPATITFNQDDVVDISQAKAYVIGYLQTIIHQLQKMPVKEA